VKKFLRVENLCFDATRTKQARATFRVDLTRTDGVEKNQVLHLQPEEESEVQRLEQDIAGLLKPHRTRISLTALSQNLWKLMESQP